MHLRPERLNRREAGIGLVETIVAAAIMGTAIGLGIYAFALGNRATAEGVRRGQAERNVVQALAIMLPEIRDAGALSTPGASTVVGPNGAGVPGKKLTFRKNVGFEGHRIAWSSDISYEWQSSGTIVRRDPSGTTATIAGGIDPTFQFAIGLAGDEVLITIGSTLALSGKGESVTHAASETVLLRN